MFGRTLGLILSTSSRTCSSQSTSSFVGQIVSSSRKIFWVNRVNVLLQVKNLYQLVRGSHLNATVDRGAYDVRFYRHVTAFRIKKLNVVPDGKTVEISWEDGKKSRFHTQWLRHSCYCPRCKMPHTGQTQVEFDQVPDDSAISSARDDGDGCLVVKWKEDPEHTGIFPLQFLKANCYSTDSLVAKRQASSMKFTTNVNIFKMLYCMKQPVIPRLSYEEVNGSTKGVYKWVKALNETGIALLEGVPCKDKMVKTMCQKIADLVQHTIYGETFDVRAVKQPINAAYAPVELKLHMDQIHYEAAPGIQALHCLKFDQTIKGGESVFVDLFQVAEAFREKYPEDFRVLCEVPSTYETLHYKREWPVHMNIQKPMITLNSYQQIIGVTWHPHLEGPLQVEEKYVEDYFRAHKRFYKLISNFPYKFFHRLQEGDLISFNNRRVLHGRAAYSSEIGERHLQGCYVEISEFKSCVRVLANLVGDGQPAVHVGDSSWL